MHREVGLVGHAGKQARVVRGCAINRAIIHRLFNAMRLWQHVMRMTAPLLLLFAFAAPAPVAAQRHSEQAEAFEARRDGRILSIRTIEARVIPAMKGAQYLGFDFDMGSAAYTLKFLRDGQVIWIYVDGRSGNIVGRTDR
ncbi:hypothetical protein SAMN05192583_2631 [Sphingomonas gellani]|uniref:Peptidase propeptide and YPEB domain-containing protein n=2 Tax=Sphingomonas gellani TaxID=1166340 RepID=A0A1H8G0I8_9SPHN|nr:hypothetical protein SAMN05192583_2631 [Sphingomonas gellani]